MHEGRTHVDKNVEKWETYVNCAKIFFKTCALQMKSRVLQWGQITDRGAPYGAEIGTEPSPLLPDPGHAGVGSRPYLYLNLQSGCPTKEQPLFDF